MVLAPQFGMSEEKPAWRSLQPTWQPAAPAVQWKPVDSPTDWQSEWLKKSEIDWKAVEPAPLAEDLDPGTPAAILLPPIGTPRVIDLATAHESINRIGSYLPKFSDPAEPTRFPVSAETDTVAGTLQPLPESIVAAETIIERLEISPRELIEVEQLPVRTPPPARALVLPPGYQPTVNGEIPEPKGKLHALLGRPIRPGQRIRGWFEKDESTAAAESPGLGEAFVESVRSKGPQLTCRDEFLLWWVRNDRVTTLGTTGTPESGGILGQPGTRSLYGPGAIDLTNRMGERSRTTLMFDEHGGYGVDASFMFLGRRHNTYTFSSEQFPVISRPVYVVNTPAG